MGTRSFEDLGVDFTEVKSCQGYRYLLVLVCTYSGWVEAYPPHTEKAQEVERALLREVITRYGISHFYQLRKCTSLHGGNSPGPG
jgi:hypothetical protein